MADHRAVEPGAGHPHDKHDALDLGGPQREAEPTDEAPDPESVTEADAGTEDDPSAG